MLQHEPRRYTPEEYFALNEAAPEGVRLEYFDGLIFHKGQFYDPSNPDLARAMAGGTRAHNAISARVLSALLNALPDCDVMPSDQQVRLPGGSYVYPDAVVSCEAEYEGHQLLTPQLIVEVLSSSTAEIDAGRKLTAYTQIDSLLEYWIVAQSEVRVTRYYRTGEGWGLRSYTALDDVIESDHLGVKVPLRELYRTVF